MGYWPRYRLGYFGRKETQRALKLHDSRDKAYRYVPRTRTNESKLRHCSLSAFVSAELPPCSPRPPPAPSYLHSIYPRPPLHLRESRSTLSPSLGPLSPETPPDASDNPFASSSSLIFPSGTIVLPLFCFLRSLNPFFNRPYRAPPMRPADVISPFPWPLIPMCQFIALFRLSRHADHSLVCLILCPSRYRRSRLCQLSPSPHCRERAHLPSHRFELG